jgi:hypothetical protein
MESHLSDPGAYPGNHEGTIMHLATKLLGNLALLSMFSILTPAFAAVDDTGGPLCGTLVNVKGKNVLEGAQECRCSGAVTLTITALGTYTATPGVLVCESVTIYGSYDTFKTPGNTEFKADKFVNDVRIDRTCDTSDCWWFFPFSGGTPSCTSTALNLPGGHQHYIAVGTCEVVPSGKDQS